jgi:hypothetical protein
VARFNYEKDAAIGEYRAGRLSQRQVGERLCLNYWQTERFLTKHKVSLNYFFGDLQADRRDCLSL